MSRFTTAEEAIAAVQSGNRLYLHSVAAVPHVLISELIRQAPRLKNVEIVHLHTEGPAPYTAPSYADSFRVNCLFIGANTRAAVQEGRADYTPVFLSEIPGLFRSGLLDVDVALIHVSPPDKHGYCSLGVTVEAAHAALNTAEVVIAQVNPQMPRTHGDALIHVDRLTYMVKVDVEIPETPPPHLGDVERAIGRHVATLVNNGATLQMGIGAIPDAVLRELHGHKDLGIHTEMFSDGLIDLVESGVVNGRCKTIHPNRIVATFVMGSRRVYDFVDDNPMVTMLDVAYVNDPTVIARNPQMTAINSAIEVDLTGQVCADSIGTMPYSGVGGQVDFIRGAAVSEGGRPIIALPSRTSKGVSRIVSMLKPGAGVVTSRAHVHYVVTEHGIAELHGRTIRQRAASLISIAHPDDRETLLREARDVHRLRL
ncbi:MAG TPA: 4-hydroxybutyrate CoA-transferase [Bacteroidetes bacterium]|nr:4-hydroxybutyrate CoA-transferase [Bacteroidota bacterium]HRK04141.1 acetyl-CoA hydrolase/transferase C-terminal domain-containing protein [Chlorobiota bacterium]